jgi:hypothetical protein
MEAQAHAQQQLEQHRQLGDAHAQEAQAHAQQQFEQNAMANQNHQVQHDLEQQAFDQHLAQQANEYHALQQIPIA